MTDKKDINILFLPMGKYWMIISFVLLISLVFVALFVAVGLKYHMLWLLLGGSLLSAIVPALFIRLKLNLIAKKGTIHFTNEDMQIIVPDSIAEKFAYSDVKCFNVTNYDGDDASRIKFILRNGFKRNYIFFRQKNNEENVLNNVLHYFSSYSNGRIDEEKILIAPSFFLSKSGKVFVAITGLIILVCISLQFIYKLKTVPVSLFAVFGAYTQIRILQIKEKRILKEFNERNN